MKIQAMTNPITMPIIPDAVVLESLEEPESNQWRWLDDPWVLVTILVATALSVGSFIYFYNHYDTLLYGDAHSHLDIARRVFDNTTPGLAQLGGVWLPLP